MERISPSNKKTVVTAKGTLRYGVLGKRKRNSNAINSVNRISPSNKKTVVTAKGTPRNRVNRKKKTVKTSVLGKRKRTPITLKKRTSPYPKKIDVGNTGDITLVTNKYARFSMSKQLVASLRDVSLESSRKMIEYAGKVDISNTTNKIVKLLSPTKMTSYMRGTVNPSPSILSTLITYHSHPSPESLGSNLNEFKNYHTLPSNTDLITYVAQYPRMQANIILDTNGYYVIDLVEGENHNIEIIKKQFNMYISKTLKGHELAVDGYLYYVINPTNWKWLINGDLNNFMKNYGVSIKYYTWSERGIITLTIQR